METLKDQIAESKKFIKELKAELEKTSLSQIEQVRLSLHLKQERKNLNFYKQQLKVQQP